MKNEFVLTLSCPERPGILHAVTSFLLRHGCDITEHQQFDDADHGIVFLRTGFAAPGTEVTLDRLRDTFAPVAAEWGMDWQLRDSARKPRVLVMVSKFDHCLADLLYRWRSKDLDAEIVLVASNHPDLEPLATAEGVPFEHVPVTADT
ncbi:formyltetrahydrofolate deformylase, partial [Streptomyces sp. NPDC059468]